MHVFLVKVPETIMHDMVEDSHGGKANLRDHPAGTVSCKSCRERRGDPDRKLDLNDNGMSLCRRV